MEKNIDQKFLVIVIEGVIGSGKSTLIKNCLIPLLSNKGWKITLVDEPVEKWEKDGLLKRFYDNPKRFGYHFQTRAFVDRVRESQLQYRKYKDVTDIFILERSVFSDVLFMNLLYKSGTVQDFEFKDYEEWWKMWTEVMPFQPDLFIYLRPDLDIAMGRVEERSRNGEEKVTKEYQAKLLKEHDDFLGGEFVTISKSHFVPCYHLSTNANFKNDSKWQDEIATKIETKIREIQQSKFK